MEDNFALVLLTLVIFTMPIIMDMVNLVMSKDRASHIEQIWGHLKKLLKNIYYSIPHENLYCFLLFKMIFTN